MQTSNDTSFTEMSGLWSKARFPKISSNYLKLSWQHERHSSLPVFKIGIQASSRDQSSSILKVTKENRAMIEGVTITIDKSFDVCGVPLLHGVDYMTWFCKTYEGMNPSSVSF